MCLKPKWIYKKGFYKESNYRGEKGDFYELGTYSKCGACDQCIAEKSNNWVIRNYYEQKRHEKKCFITLTYAENPVILVRKDLQDFIKRLRTYLKRKCNFNDKIRIFYCGEYGERNNRPHFHLIIYGWEEEKLNFLDINKKKNILYQSKTIQTCWGLGRTSYQNFDDKEIPYISLYNTAQQEFKKAYKMNMEKIRKLKDYAKQAYRMPEKQRNNLYAELKDIQKELEQTKKEYIACKEFNGWSLALGWEQFYTEYAKAKEYTWQEFIEGAQYATPTPWVKKLANMGDFKAALEMYRREEMIEQSANETEERIKNVLKIQAKKKDEIIENSDKKDQLEDL